MKKRIMLALMAFSMSFCGLQADNLLQSAFKESFETKSSAKMYIDEDELAVKGDAFHIHIGHNVWLVTNTVHRDSTGLYTFDSNLSRFANGPKMEYERQWKCPYCYSYWPIGKSCQNRECPSRY